MGGGQPGPLTPLARAATDLCESLAILPNDPIFGMRLASNTVRTLCSGKRRPRWPSVREFVAVLREYHAGRADSPDLPADTFDTRRWRRLWSASAPSTGTGLVVGPVPRLAAGFQPREIAALSVLDAERSGSPRAPTCVILRGLGGVGKTQAAANAARRRAESGDPLLLVWVAGSSRDQILADYAEAFTAVSGVGDLDYELAATRLLTWLTNLRQPWLVVVDDLVAPDDLHRLWPPTTAYGRTIVTTRRTDHALHHPDRLVVTLGEFSPDEAHAYLATKLGDTGPDLALLAAELGHLPLALSQAATLMLDKGWSCDRYLNELAKLPLDAVHGGHGSLPDEHAAAVSRAWDLSIAEADGLAPAGLARPVLELASLLDPNGVPDGLFGTGSVLAHLTAARTPQASVPAPAVADDARDALRCLHRFSLVTLDPDAPGEIAVHTLVQRVVRDRLPTPRRRSAVAALASGMLSTWPRLESDQLLAQRLRANATALMRTGGDVLCADGVHPLLFRLGRSIGDTGAIADAAGHFRQLLDDLAAHLPAAHPDTLRLRHDEMYWIGTGGDHKGAARLADALIADCAAALGPRAELTLTARMYRARWDGLDDQPTRATAGLAVLVGEFTDALGEGHQLTLTARNDLAHFGGVAGDPAGAAKAFRVLVRDRIRWLGATHEDTMLARNSFAFWTWKADDLATAIPAFELLVDECANALGDDHRYTLGVRGNLAQCRGEAGAPAVAAAELELVAEDLTRVLGAAHPMTVSSRRYLAHWRAVVDATDRADS